MKTLKIIIGLIILVLVIWGLASLLGGKTPTTTETGPIKIGFISALTGDVSSVGTVNKAAAEIAVEEINAAGGINGRQIEMIYEDGKCSAKDAVNAAQKLISIDKVSVIIGGLCSTETSAFVAQAMQDKVIVFSPGSSAPGLSQAGQYFFRSYPSDNFQGKFAAEYAYNTLGARKVAVIYHISDWGSGVKDVFVSRFKELGGQIVTEEGSPQTARDYRTSLTKIRDLKPDLVFAPLYPDGAIVALKQAQETGLKVEFMGADSWDDPKLQKEASYTGGDVIYSVVTNAASDEFKAKVKAKTGGDEFPIATANTYDNVKLIAQIIGQVGTNTDKIKDALRQVSYQGMSGLISFDQNGDLTSASYVVKKFVDGSAVEVK